MLNISRAITAAHEKRHFDGFITHIKAVLNQNTRFKITPEFNVEKKFYRALLMDREFARSIILGKADKLSNLANQPFYKKHRLFVLLTLHEKVRKTEPFNTHLRLEFKNLPRDIRKKISLDEISHKIRDRCFKVFNYDKFAKIERGKKYSGLEWNVYNYLKQSSPKVCPYCNLELTTIITDTADDSGTTYILRSALDHYLAQALFPIYGLSIYNLIPSCNTCNSSLKNSINFMKNKHLCPMIDSFSEDANFALRLKNRDLIYKAIDDIYNENKIDQEKFDLCIESKCNKVKNSSHTFKIISRYSHHTELYFPLLEKLRATTPDNIRIYKETLNLSSDKEAKDTLLDFKINESEYINNPLSILKRDLIARYSKS